MHLQCQVLQIRCASCSTTLVTLLHCKQQHGVVTGRTQEAPGLLRETECTFLMLRGRDVAAALQWVMSGQQQVYTFWHQFSLVMYQAAQSNRLRARSKAYIFTQRCSWSYEAGWHYRHTQLPVHQLCPPDCRCVHQMSTG